MKKNMLIALLAVIALVGGGISTATAAGLIGHDEIKVGAVHSDTIHDGTIRYRDINGHVANRLKGQDGIDGVDGKDGKDGKDGLAGAVYRVENYLNGGGGSATVACADDPVESQKYTAISGGVEGSTVASQSADGFAVSSSFPGRMDWDTGLPKVGRLDGWIILGNGNYTSTLKVWALCVPNTNIPVQQVDLDN